MKQNTPWCVLLAVMALLAASPSLLEAQIGKRLRDAAARTAEREVTRQVERKGDNPVRCVADDRECIRKAESEGKQVEVVDRQGNPVPPAAAPSAPTPAPAAPATPAAPAAPATDSAARAEKAERDARAEREAQAYLAAMMAAQAPSARIPDPDKGILEMTDAVLVRFIAALRAEAAVRATAARTFTESHMERYNRCTMDLQNDPKGAALEKRWTDRLEQHGHDAEALRLEKEIESYIVAKCGEGPEQFGKRASRQGEEAGKFSDREYAHLKERCTPFYQANGGSTGSYAYTDAERAALNKHASTLKSLCSASE